ncbi:hypothetical protein HY494_02295 [Candidatus Woesearchaeota archaeon]|nr:hypothetical protein [Candidatus Woesearchaeota archaeon]
MFPEESLEEAMADMLRAQWRRQDELTGKRVGSLDELKENLPEDQCWGRAYENNDTPITETDVYSRDWKSSPATPQYVAYECNNDCKGIVIGPPTIEAFNTIAPLSGKQGVKYACVRCNASLYEMVIGWS